MLSDACNLLSSGKVKTECLCAQLLQSCPTQWDPVDCSPPGSSVPGILQARILEWVAMPTSRGSSRSRDQTCLSYVPWQFWTSSTTWQAPFSHRFPANRRPGQCPVGKWHHGPSLENLTSPKKRDVKILTPGFPSGPPSSAHREFHTDKYTRLVIS